MRETKWAAFHAVVFLIAAAFLFYEGINSGLTDDIWFGLLTLIPMTLAVLSAQQVKPFYGWFSFFSPIALCSLTFIFYFFMVLGVNPDADPLADLYIICTFILVWIFQVSWWPWAQKIMRFGAHPRYGVKTGAALLIMFSITGWIGLMIAAWAGGVGSLWQVYADPLQMRTFMSRGGMGYFKLICDFMVFMPPTIATIKRYAEGNRLWYLSLLIVSAALYSLASGSRGATVGLAINLLLIRHLLGKPIRPLILLIIGLLVIPFVAVMGVIRNNPVLYAMNTASVLRIIATLGPEKLVMIFLERLDASYYFNLLMQRRGTIDINYGSSYLMWPLQVIPRALWHNKPLLPSTYLTYRLVTGPESNSTFDFSIFGESYLNFGFMGIISGAIAVVGFTTYMQRRYDRLVKSRDAVDVLFFSMMWLLVIYLVVNGVFGTTTAACIQLVQFWVARRIFFRRLSGTST
jgi:hypothetical protein